MFPCPYENKGGPHFFTLQLLPAGKSRISTVKTPATNKSTNWPYSWQLLYLRNNWRRGQDCETRSPNCRDKIAKYLYEPTFGKNGKFSCTQNIVVIQYVHSTFPYLVVTKINVWQPCLNFAICISHMLPRWLCLLNALVVWYSHTQCDDRHVHASAAGALTPACPTLQCVLKCQPSQLDSFFTTGFIAQWILTRWTYLPKPTSVLSIILLYKWYSKRTAVGSGVGFWLTSDRKFLGDLNVIWVCTGTELLTCWSRHVRGVTYCTWWCHTLRVALFPGSDFLIRSSLWLLYQIIID